MEKELNQKSREIKNGEDKDIKDDKFVAALSYVWIFCFVPLFLRKESKFAQFHAKQGLVLFLMEIVGPLVFWLPFFGWLLFLGVLVLAVMGFINALSGNYWEMPYLGKYAKKINL